MKNKIITFPNFLSCLRLPLAVLIIYSSSLTFQYVFLFLAIFLDWFDGYIARKLNQATKLGAIIDPLFDRIFVVVLFLFFLTTLKLPFYFIVLFFFRDIFTVTAGLIVLITKFSKIDIKARFLGKIVTFLQFFVLVFMLSKNISLITYGIYFLFFMSLLALIDYAIYIKKIIIK
jgi:CDP-diacylglycerol--glycerol-3-phosphate 3-phosphatidyltransferase